MKILILNHEYPPLGGGSAVATKHLADALAGLGHRVMVLAPAADDSNREECGVEVKRFRVAMRAGELAGIRTWLSFLRRAGGALRGAVASFQPDVIHSHFLFPSGFVATRAKTGIPHVSSTVGAEIHDPSRPFAADKNRIMRACIRHVIRKARVVTTSARDLTTRLEALYPVLSTPICEVPWPVPPLTATGRGRVDLDLPRDAFVITSLCRLVPRKRLDLLLRAVALLRRPGVYLVVMGFGPLEAELRDLADELRISGAVRLAGQVTESDKAAYLENSDVFCLPSDHEGFGLAFVEAMSLGIPVIATDVGGQTDVIRDGVEGFLVPRGDAEALAERIETLRANPAQLAEMKAAAEVRARDYAPEQVAGRFLELYERACESA